MSKEHPLDSFMYNMHAKIFVEHYSMYITKQTFTEKSRKMYEKDLLICYKLGTISIK